MSGSTRALVLEAPGRLVAREFATPEVGDDDAVVRVEACGLCGTDHEQFSGVLATPGPIVPGHETVGVVEAIGPTAAARWGVAAGDRIAVEVFLSCRKCDACVAGAYRRCREHGLRDMYGFVAADRAPGLWGGYAQHQYLAPGSMVLPVPSSLDPIVATLFNPVGAGIRWAVTVPELQPGAVVAVLGPGVRGLAACAAAKAAGAGFVLVTGAGPRDAARLAVAADFGADAVVDVTVADPVRTLRSHAGAGADVVVDVTAYRPASTSSPRAGSRSRTSRGGSPASTTSLTCCGAWPGRPRRNRRSTASSCPRAGLRACCTCDRCFWCG